MIFSAKYSHIVLRLGLAFVLFWFGIDKFFHPDYWLNAWIPQWLSSLAGKFGASGTQLIYVNGIFEILAGLSLVTGIFMRFFSLVSVVFLICVAVFSGFTEMSVRNVGLVGGFLAIILWPEQGR